MHLVFYLIFSKISANFLNTLLITVFLLLILFLFYFQCVFGVRNKANCWHKKWIAANRMNFLKNDENNYFDVSSSLEKKINKKKVLWKKCKVFDAILNGTHKKIKYIKNYIFKSNKK